MFNLEYYINIAFQTCFMRVYHAYDFAIFFRQSIISLSIGSIYYYYSKVAEHQV